ncbi:flp pilus-assembly TadE/G-like family protein [Kocuria sp. p3-SID1433]|uniref:Rv3654c family TadE-like protein n=1 Tax=unclassified Kocuria TaxID=2649579 RepID=UPI0021A7181B|nr:MULTISPECIES: Rv3654c family TadE-like protein [unclassified Kocuria]MCT1602206.1 flp pilus-assembly TadE/G-like family protein [Kocuria sp. p3-SID1428]MCT2179663.1 flp pilus-assembly TadE/G-like family protein [Kocuria sp. p3-SID1433]
MAAERPGAAIGIRGREHDGSSGEEGRHPDLGAGTVLGLILALVAVFLIVAALGVGQAAILTHRAENAADLSALAAADTARGLRIGQPCEVAAELAELNGAEVLDCAVVGPEATTVDVEVGIDLPSALSVFGQARGRSRAGAPQDSPFA